MTKIEARDPVKGYSGKKKKQLFYLKLFPYSKNNSQKTFQMYLFSVVFHLL